MSTVDPDARSRALRDNLRFTSRVLIVVALLSGPVLGLLMWSVSDVDAAFVPIYLGWLFLTVGAGIFAQYVSQHLEGWLVAAYTIAGVGSLFLIMGLGVGREAGGGDAGKSFGFAVILYAIAAVLFARHTVQKRLEAEVRRDGVTTQAEVTRAGVMGMVNSVPIWHITLRFTDRDGTTRWVKRHVVSPYPFSVGGQVSLRYDPEAPGRTMGMLIGGDAQ